MKKKEVTVTITGIRRAAAIIETTPITLTTNPDGDQEGSEDCDVTDPVNAVVTLTGAPNASFSVAITVEKLGTATKKGRLKDDFAVRFYDIPFDEFE
jgi:hypothetical protein